MAEFDEDGGEAALEQVGSGDDGGEAIDGGEPMYDDVMETDDGGDGGDEVPSGSRGVDDPFGRDDDDDDDDYRRGGEGVDGFNGATALTPRSSGQITHDARDPERRFCPQCGNMWQPREERSTRTLMLTCRTCGYEEPAHTGKVYENRIIKEVSMRLDAINPEVVQDPTLQRSNQVTCDSCGHNEAVLFQAEAGIKAVSLSLIFVCCECGNKWVG